MNVGDKVAVMFRGVTKNLSVIERETANYWIVEGFKYRKKDGYEAGISSNLGYHIKEATKEDCDRYRRDKMIARLKQQNWENFSTSELTDIVAVVCGFADARSLPRKEEEGSLNG